MLHELKEGGGPILWENTARDLQPHHPYGPILDGLQEADAGDGGRHRGHTLGERWQRQAGGAGDFHFPVVL